MGVFKWNNNDKPAPSTHQSSSKINSNPTTFYAEFVSYYHQTAISLNYENRGVIFVPELIPIGLTTVSTFLKDKFFQMEYGNIIQQYYFVIITLSLQSGLVFADKWDSDFSSLTSSYIDQILNEGSADVAEILLKSELGLNKQHANHFYAQIYERWIAMHEPYWNLSDQREYTFNAILAAYQLGISMILEKYGY